MVTSVNALQRLLSRDARSIKNATPEQLNLRMQAVHAANMAGVKYIKQYANMSHGKLRVKLYGLYRYDEHEKATYIDVHQRELLVAAGFKLNDLYSAQSATMYID